MIYACFHTCVHYVDADTCFFAYFFRLTLVQVAWYFGLVRMGTLGSHVLDVSLVDDSILNMFLECLFIVSFANLNYFEGCFLRLNNFGDVFG